MKRRLRPVRTQRRARFRLTLPTVVLPLLAVVVLGRGQAIRAPLGEREATLALAAQPHRTPLSADAPVDRPGPWTAATLALTSVGPRVLSSSELHLRVPGLLAGAATLGAAVILGERLFATRVGLVAALLLLILPAGRSLLGTELGAEPFYLLATIVAVTAARDTGEARRSAVVAGMASGIAIAIGGGDGLWLPVLSLLWLWWNQGLTLRSFAAVVLSTLAAAAATVAAAQLWLLRAPPAGGANALEGLAFRGLTPQLADSLPSPSALGWGLLPLAPFAALGVASLPKGWAQDSSLRFVLLWLALGTAAFAATGTEIPAWIAAVYLAATLAVWGLDRTGRPAAAAALITSIALGFAVHRFTYDARAGQPLDRWAVRETGRFLRRVIPAERRVASAPEVNKRLAFYGRRPIDPLRPGERDFAQAADYVVLSRDEFRSVLRAARQTGEPGDRQRRPGPALRMTAEFGTWVVARVTSPSPESRAVAPGDGRDSPSVRPPQT